MFKKIKSLGLLAIFCVVFMPVTAVAQDTFDGMPKVAEWVDFENTSNEMPAVVWGSCDADQADRVGIVVEFDDGTFGSASYSGVSSLWNSSFSGLSPDTSNGFFGSCGALHYLFNTGSSLPMAWESCSMTYSSNFDLDYTEYFGSHFRASTTGWVSARIQTYCGVAAAAEATPVPTLSLLSLTILGSILMLFGFFGLRRRSQTR